MDVNLDGVFFVARAILKIMMKQGSGKVINTGKVERIYSPPFSPTNISSASMWGLGASSGLAPIPAYCAAKVAVPVNHRNS